MGKRVQIIVGGNTVYDDTPEFYKLSEQGDNIMLEAGRPQPGIGEQLAAAVAQRNGAQKSLK